MKRSSASITLVLIGSVVALGGCDQRPSFSPGDTSGRSDYTTGTRTRHRSGMGFIPFLGRSSSRYSAPSSGVSGRSGSTMSGSTTRGGFGSGRGSFGG